MRRVDLLILISISGHSFMIHIDLGKSFIRLAQMLPQGAELKPIIRDVVAGLNLPGMKDIQQIEVSGNGEDVFVYFQIDVDAKVYEAAVTAKPSQEGVIKNAVKNALEQHFQLNRFIVSFSYFPASFKQTI